MNNAPLRHLVLTGDRNTTDEHDFTGAFEPESLRYVKHWRAAGDRVDLVRVDLSLRGPARVAAMEAALSASAPVDRFVLLCHGWMTGVQLGLSSATAADLSRLASFAARLAAASTSALKVALYCCGTGRSDGPPGDGGEGSFADLLRDGLVASGRPDVTVFAHTSAGHTTRNAAVRMFCGTAPGVDLAKPGTAAWERLNKRLHSGSDDFRWELPYLSLDEAREELA